MRSRPQTSLSAPALALTLALLAVLTLFPGCSDRLRPETGGPCGGTAILHFGLEAYADTAVRSTSPAEEARLPLSALYYAVADLQGRIIALPHARLESDCSKLTIEGLSAGDYRIAVLATTAADSPVEIRTLNALSDIWLQQETDAFPGEDWFYACTGLHIGEDQSPLEQRILLQRSTGRIDIDLQTESEYIEPLIRDIRIAFDPACTFYTALTGEGRPASAAGIQEADITRSRSLQTLPSSAPVSGTVCITALNSDGSEFVRSYRFSDCTVRAGHITRIVIPYRHPQDQEGTIRIRESDFARFAADTMFLASEPREIFYDNTRRWFYADRPLQAGIDREHRLRIRFYSPVPVRGVTVRCRFNRVSLEYFDLAHFDLVYPFMEAAFPLPVTRGDRWFTAADGRRVLVPAQPGLSEDDLRLEIVCDDPFMQKIAAIDSRWLINFSPFGADQGHPYWRHMTPELCRHGVALALNMAYMFSSPEFNAALETYRGLLTDDSGDPIDLDELRTGIRNHPGLTLGLVTGVGGLGGGRTYGLADYCYRQVYWDYDPEQPPHTYTRMAMFHEYGHCLGYGHASTMTYGDRWTVLCSETFVEMGRGNKLPVSSRTLLDNLPM